MKIVISRLLFALGFCLPQILVSSQAQSPALFITGLPCPGDRGEPTASHPLSWQGRSGFNSASVTPWTEWTNTVQISYGDVVFATWFEQCRFHVTTWPYARLDLVYTNGTGALETNSATISMRAGYNFAANFVYWYTNGSALLPTNFTAAECAVLVRTNFTPVLGSPTAFAGTIIDPPLWIDETNAITNPSGWPQWSLFPDGTSFLPLVKINADGAAVISPSAQLPMLDLNGNTNGSFDLKLQGLPGNFVLQRSLDLEGVWTNYASVTAGSDGGASLAVPFAEAPTAFFRAQGTSALSGVGFTMKVGTTGRVFNPAVYCSNGPVSDFLWTWSDGSTSSSYPLASKDFGTSARRVQNLTVVPNAAITAINLGFDASDGGETTPLPTLAAQKVNSVSFSSPLPSLRYWASSYNSITNTLDFTGFTSLEAIECFHATTLQHVVVTHLPSLKRVCFEACDLQELVLTGNPELEDVRAALNSYTEIVLGEGTGPKIWHFCARDNEQLTQNLMELMTNFYSLREPWIWHDNQSGAISFVSTNLTDVEFQDNFYASADFNGQPNLQILWAYGNQLTNLSLTGCVFLQDLQAQNNQFTGAALDRILSDLDAWPTNLQTVNLLQNPGSPSVVGYAHYSSLTNKGVVVYLDFAGTNGPLIEFDSFGLLQESCAPTNNAIDPGETVTILLALRNSGNENNSNLTVTLLTTNGIVSGSGSQTYGALAAGGAPASQPFTFSTSGTCGATLSAVFQLQDNGLDLGKITVPIDLGVMSIPLAQNFDATTAPDLPSGWTASAPGGIQPWRTVNTFSDAGPNAAAASDSVNPGVNELLSPAVTLPNAPARLSFRNNYDLEPGAAAGIANDGGVLEIQIGTNVFQDIIAAGGAFVSGGYNTTITNIWGNPLADRAAWGGNSSGYITTSIDLPPSALGETITLRWLCATDMGNDVGSLAGWRIDTVQIRSTECCTAAPMPLQTNSAITPGQSSRKSAFP